MEHAPVAIVKAFLVDASFPAEKPGGCEGLAWIHLEDDSDCHAFKVAVPHEFVRAMADWLHKCGDVRRGDGNEPMMMVAFAPCAGELPQQAGPTLQQLLAVWNASSFVEDAGKRGRCAVCDRDTEEVDDAGPPDAGIPRCDRSCPGAALRAARAMKEDEP